MPGRARRKAGVFEDAETLKDCLASHTPFPNDNVDVPLGVSAQANMCPAVSQNHGVTCGSVRQDRLRPTTPNRRISLRAGLLRVFLPQGWK